MALEMNVNPVGQAVPFPQPVQNEAYDALLAFVPAGEVAPDFGRLYDRMHAPVNLGVGLDLLQIARRALELSPQLDELTHEQREFLLFCANAHIDDYLGQHEADMIGVEEQEIGQRVEAILNELPFNHPEIREHGRAVFTQAFQELIVPIA